MAHMTPITSGLVAAVVGGMLHGAASADVVILDPGFDSALGGDFAVDQNDAGAGWRAPGSGNWAQSNDVSGHTAATRTGNFDNALLQVIHDDGASTGGWTLSFEAINTDTWTNPGGENPAGFNTLNVSVYGVNESSFQFTTGSGIVDSNAVLLGGIDVLDGASANSFGWTSFQTNIDLGTGYEYLVIRIAGKLNSGAGSETAGELLAVDSVSLVPEPASVALLFAGAGLMAVRPRRSSQS